MELYSGNLSIYFPCQLKDKNALQWFHQKWNRCRNRQVRDIHLRKAPLTDLMDLKAYREEKEGILEILHAKIDVFGNVNPECAPYALPCLQQAYRKTREDNLFTKNANVLISRFKLIYPKEQNSRISNTEGCLIYNVNADNNIATYIVTLRFNNLLVEDIVLLKHIFYKRLKVEIQEYDICYHKCGSEPWHADNCFSCISKHHIRVNRPYNSIQEYVAEKDMCQRFAKKMDVDYRARYTFVELDNTFFNKSDHKEYYGIMCADEGYSYLSSQRQEEVFKHNLSAREAYGYYQCGLDGLIVNKKKPEKVICKERRAEFEGRYDEAESHIKTNDERKKQHHRENRLADGLSVSGLGDHRLVQHLLGQIR